MWILESRSATLFACQTVAPPAAVVSRIVQVVDWWASPLGPDQADGSTSMCTAKLLATCPSFSGSRITGAAGAEGVRRCSRGSASGLINSGAFLAKRPARGCDMGYVRDGVRDR